METNGPVDLWRCPCVGAPGFLPAFLHWKSAKRVIRSSDSGDIFRLGHRGVRHSAFRQRETYRSGRPALVSGTAPLGVSHWHGPRCHGCSDLPRAKNAVSRYSPRNDSFSLFSVPSYSSHPVESARSAPMDQRLRNPGPVWRGSRPGQHSAKRFKIARSAPDLPLPPALVQRGDVAKGSGRMHE